MKGIILAGGNGSRLYPLTRAVSKQLLPIYNKPLIYYPLSVLQSFGINDVLIITNNQHNTNAIKNTIGNTKSNIVYATQPSPNGLAEAFIIGEEFIKNDNVTLILGDNIFHGYFPAPLHVNKIYGIHTKSPELYGCVEFDENFNLKQIVEKPAIPTSNYAVPGLYHFDKTVSDRAKKLKPSERGELEITDLINGYINDRVMQLDVLDNSMVWFDCGNVDHLLEAGNFVKAIESRSSIRIGNIY